MITGNKLINADWQWLKAERKSDGNYEEWECTFDGVKIIKKTKKKRVLGQLIASEEQEWYICDGYYFANRRHLLSYVNERELANKKPRVWVNQFALNLEQGKKSL